MMRSTLTEVETPRGDSRFIGGKKNPFTYIWNEDQESDDNFSVIGNADDHDYRKVTEHSSYHDKLFMEQDEYQKRQKKFNQSKELQHFMISDSMFFAWECVSIILKNRTTIDFVIKDNYSLMVFLHLVHHKLYQPKKLKEELGCLRSYKLLKVKMKLSY